MQKITKDIAKKMGWYVYRLIYPRNGETFYVGKGKGSRVLEQKKMNNKAFSIEDDEIDLKFSRIKAIESSGLEVNHVIHRHNIATEDIAYQIEAALIDSYPGLTNRIAGHDFGYYECRHLKQIIDYYKKDDFLIEKPLILISINKSLDDPNMNIYDATRGCWKVNPEKVNDYKLVLAHFKGTVIKAYRPKFPWLEKDLERYGFIDTEAEDEIKNKYIQKNVPSIFRKKGAANPIRFLNP
jgi:hypothetical protein